MSARRIEFLHWLLIASSTGSVGCSTTRSFKLLASVDRDQKEALYSDARSAAEAMEPRLVGQRSAELRQVGFEVLEPEEEDKEEEEKESRETGSEVVPYIIDDVDDRSQPFYSGQSTMTLADFESLALGNNPTIQELVATTQKAAGFRTQVGLRANPIVGYNGTQIADAGTDQHTAFISQTIITANKLALNRRILNEALRAQLLQLEAQKYRIATDIRVAFYSALAAQNRVKLIQDFQSVADKGLELAERRKKALEGSQLEVVQAKVQKNEIDLALQQAEVTFAASWRELVALAGSTQMPPVTLLGELPHGETSLDWTNLAQTMVVSSPEYQAAQTRVSQARANIDRQGVQAIPNLDVQFGAGVDNGTNSGLMNLQIGAPIPVFNKNQGNIAAATC